MKESLKTGITFGLTSGVITTLGLMVGLHSGTGSRIAIIGGILTIAVADAFSDALGIHVSEEAENVHTPAQVWGATIATFLSKFLFALTFLVPVVLLPLKSAMLASLGWGILILTLLSCKMAQDQEEPCWKIVSEHLLIGVIVIAITHYVGDLVHTYVH